MAIVRELVTRFGFNVDKTGMNNVENSINRLSGMLSGLAAFASIRALAGVADSMQSLEARIGMLPQTIGDVGAAFNEVAKNASDNRQSIEAYGSFYTKVGNAAKGLIKDQSELLQVTNTISQALVVGGANTMEAQSAMLQFGQALGSGVLQGDEFRSMAEAAPQYLDALAEAMGYPREQLKKMASEGKLSSKAVIEATLKMSTMFQEKFRQMPMTVGAATTIIGNKFKTMIAGLNRESQVVTNVANFLLNGFNRIESGAKSFIEFVGGSTNALKTFGIAIAAILSPLALGGLFKLILAILSPAGLLVGVVLLLGLVIDDVVNYLNGGQSAFGSFIKWMSDGSLGAAIFKGSLISLGSVLALYVVYLSTLAKAWFVVKIASIQAGLAMASAWIVAMSPLALILIGIAAISTAAFLLWDNWDAVMGWMGDKVKWVIEQVKNLGSFFGIGSSPATPNVAPASIANATSGGNTNVTSNQTVNLTVPPGTPESQQAFLKTSAGVLKSEGSDKKMARDMATGGW